MRWLTEKQREQISVHQKEEEESWKDAFCLDGVKRVVEYCIGMVGALVDEGLEENVEGSDEEDMEESDEDDVEVSEEEFLFDD